MTSRNLAFILIVLAVALGVLGVTEYQESTAAIEIGDLEISASDSGSQNLGMIYLGLALVSFAGGIFILRR